ncbi:enoyl-CoA hydratase/isomerase family protein [Aeromicrobium alkaliterrae]|uniref:Enoyl-CoA hydratase/isomerase family protein n=1 Tax=Aeromicrobium alkaliterrae TaxID=302168 RepID=A0ABP4W5X5_9ACTN
MKSPLAASDPGAPSPLSLTATPELLVDRADGIVTITLNRPDRKNSVTSLGWADLRDALRTIDPRTDRAVVVTGAGETFCAGADLAGNDDTRSDLENMRIVGEVCREMFHLTVPTVAAVDGAAVGAGMNLALACDFVVATDRVRFCEIFSQRALSVDFGGSWLLPRLVGLAKAKELVLLADFLTADQAHELGLVHRVVAPGDLGSTARDLAARLAAGPQTAITLSKALLNHSFETTLEGALEDEARAQAISLQSGDAKEAFSAFLEKRPATYTRPTARREED